jgi:peptidoglycan/xylan/chitin deacetylase (PgdA/CDA1 family)
MRIPLAASLAGKILALLSWHYSPWLAGAFFFGPDFYILWQMLSPSGQGLGPVVTRFETARREVWLTIDDGPDGEDTPRILDLLDRHHARATFFVIGWKADAHPALIREIVRRGHEVAHHSQRHPVLTFWCAGPGRLRSELDDGIAALGRAGVRPRWFRPPLCIKNLLLFGALSRRGLRCVGWSARGFDCVRSDPEEVVKRVMREIAPGAIILMHEGETVPRPLRVAALARLLAVLSGQGFSCVVPEEAQLRCGR